MVPHFWGQDSVGPVEASVLNLYKFQRPQGCYYSASQKGCPPPPDAMSFDACGVSVKHKA